MVQPGQNRSSEAETTVTATSCMAALPKSQPSPLQSLIWPGCTAQARYRRVREAFAAAVQGTAADLIKRLLLCLLRKLPAPPAGPGSAARSCIAGDMPDQASCAVTPRLLGVCHNEIVVEAEEGQLEGVLQV